ncbi:sulfatase-like hydrolase/transferase [Pontiellaceae bacterium B12227]|nr:sulfatase-like hydrolase/transferase [Pontiellaceae bacterium B12227]
MKKIAYGFTVAMLAACVVQAGSVTYSLGEVQTVDINGVFPATADNSVDKFDVSGVANNVIAPFDTTAYLRGASASKPGRTAKLYLQFDLTGLTAQTISGATLAFDAYSLNDTVDLTLSVHQLTSDWDPSGMPDPTWDPAVITTIATGQSIISGTGTDQYDGGGTGDPIYRNTTSYSLDVSTIVENWQSGDSNNGFMIEFNDMASNNGIGLDTNSVQLSVTEALPVDTTRPNVILIMADDMGYGDPSYINASVLQADGVAHPDQGWIQTPNMDAMATAGLRFDRFYSASAVCSPTRASCLTGRNPFRVGVPFANDGYLGADETPLSELLSAQGYATGHFGKWHLGTMTTLRTDSNRGSAGNTVEYHPPWQFNYDVCFATESKVPTYHPYRKTVNGSALPTAYTMNPTLGYTITDANFYGTHYWTMPTNPATAAEGVVVPLDVVNNATDGDDSKLITDQAIAFIKESVSNETPFFVVLWYHTPHRPMVDPLEIADTDSAIALKGGIEDMDTAIGNLRTELGALGVRTNTMLWLTSDNGPASSLDSTTDEVQNPIPERTIRSGGLLDRKASFYEGGIRVPGILEWPAVIPSGTNTSFLSSTSDYYPTILDYLGLSVPDQKALDGISLRPVIEGTLAERPSPIGFLLGGNSPEEAWISQDYKLVEVSGGEWALYDMTLPDHQLEATALATESNVSGKPQAIQDIYNTMMADYTAWKATVDADTAYTNATTPAVTLSAVSETEVPFSVTISFDKAVEGLNSDDLIVAGGTAGAVSGSGTSYTVQITPTYIGDISVRLPQGAAFAADGTPSLPSNELLVDVLNAVELETIESTVSFDGGSHTTVDSEDFSPAIGSNNLDKFDGVGEPFATTLYVRGSPQAARQVRAFLEFDLSALDASSVDAATLHLNGYSLNDFVPVSLEAIAAAEEWSTTPSYTLGTLGTAADGGSIITGLDTNLVRDYTFDVTEMVAAWTDGSWTNYGMMLQVSTDTENNGVGFQLTGNDAPWLSVNQIPLKVLQYQISSPSSTTNAQFNLIAQGATGSTIYLHKSENLLSNDWAVIDSASSTEGVLYFSEPISNSTSGFYRVSTESMP